MKRKISARIFMAYWLLVFLIAGSCILCYKVFFPYYYDMVKDKQIREAYMDIQDLDLANLDDEEHSVFAEYEGENLSFTIADEELNPVYTTRNNKKYLIYRNIKMKQDLFSKTPEVIERDSKLKETTKLRGIITQNNIDYYIVIKDTIQKVGEASISEQFFIVAAVIIILFASLIIWRFAKTLSAPMERLVDMTDKIVGGDYDTCIEVGEKQEEVARLAENINSMAIQLRHDKIQIEEGRSQQLRQNMNQERIEKIHKEFMANISHELKTPLAVISSQSEMLEYAEGDKKKYYLSSIREEVEKISGMVGGLLDVSAMEHHMEGMVQKTLDMKEVMEYILMKYEGLAKKKHLHMETFLEEECFVYGDQEYIEQAVNNYMMNAMEHIALGGNIRVTLKRQKEDIRVGVYNTGRQIPEEDMERIWSGFYSTKEKKAKTFSNVGLGLYIVQNVVAMQNGKCGVKNLPQGVEFWFTLPGITVSN